ncbi:unnamed protein product [Soboliphyme baturini]|uniref:Uncharacterized protein n=1 Tax=Soboliphyme baturini TaxID=241478 RepID=A0A183IH61_9BILA|nr:unnamed protein product [Soboliphyme baturini]
MQPPSNVFSIEQKENKSYDEPLKSSCNAASIRFAKEKYLSMFLSHNVCKIAMQLLNKQSILLKHNVS